MPVIHEKRIVSFKGRKYEIDFAFYKDDMTDEEYSSLETDRINLKQLRKQYVTYLKNKSHEEITVITF